MQLGAWAPYLDEPDMFGWYELPVELRADCEAFVPDGTELAPLNQAAYTRLHDAAVRYANQSVADFTVPYHGPEHFRLTEANGLDAARKLEELRGVRFPVAVLQNLALALRLHDCHHCGSTFRADCPTPERLPWPELPLATSAEWISARAASRFAATHGLNAPARLFQTQVIWASTFGGATPRGQELGIPNLQPAGLWGRIMRAADVCPPASFDEWIAGGLAVNYGEIPATPASHTWHGYVQAQLSFAGYIRHCFAKLDEAAGAELTSALGWQTRLDAYVARVEVLQAGNEPRLEAWVRSQAVAYGVTLA